MNDPTRALQAQGQGLWLDAIGPSLLHGGVLQRYVDGYAVTGLASSPLLFEQAFDGEAYGGAIRALVAAGHVGEALFYELTLAELAQSADLLRPVFDASDGADGWVSLEVSPLLADNTAHTIQAASRLFERAGRANLFIKMAGTPEGVRAVEEVIFDGVPVNVSLLFSREHYLAAAEAYMRAIERRLAAGLQPAVASVASLCVSGWDVAVREEIAPTFHNRLGIAMAMRTYRAHRELLVSDRWQRLAALGARPQRLLWSGMGMPDPAAPDTLYVQALVAPGTLTALPERTLLAFADHGRVGAAMPADGGYADAVLEEFRREGVDDTALAQRLQREGVEACATSWHAMLSRLREKSVP